MTAITFHSPFCLIYHQFFFLSVFLSSFFLSFFLSVLLPASFLPFLPLSLLIPSLLPSLPSFFLYDILVTLFSLCCFNHLLPNTCILQNIFFYIFSIQVLNFTFFVSFSWNLMGNVGEMLPDDACAKATS